MNFTLAQKMKAHQWVTLAIANTDPDTVKQLRDELLAELGEDALDELQELAHQRIKELAEEAEDAAGEDKTDAVPELLESPRLPGYLLDAWGVPHREAGPRRKAGKVKLDNRLFTRKGQKGVVHMARYRLTVDGKQKSFYPRYLMRARLHAEQEWKNNLESS